MHDYMRAIGFSDIHSRQESRRLMELVLADPEGDYIFSEKNSLAGYEEKYRTFVPNAGIAVRGDVDENGAFLYDYDFPFYTGHVCSLVHEISLEKMSERNEYSGVGYDITNLGVSLVFHMNRLEDYAEDIRFFSKFCKKPTGEVVTLERLPVALSGLSIYGTVLLPLIHREKKHGERKTMEERSNMLAAARQGDESAIENLTMQDLDMYAQVNKRLQGEDVLSIVDTYVIPYGISCDHYSILGEIKKCSTAVNPVSGETVCQMLVETNGICIDICINQKDLFGEPAPGRRFKGVIWLQGCKAEDYNLS